MTFSNICLVSVVSNPFDKTANSIMQEVLASKVIDNAKILKMIYGSCKNKILDSLIDSEIDNIYPCLETLNGQTSHSNDESM